MLEEIEANGFVAGPFAFVFLACLVEEASALAEAIDEPSHVGGFAQA